ncbi:MAG: adenylyltransferase/cytidyltransferase family protein, partial [Actinobacteria bacterium]|nr:adenylyltransferase/cytidyltransferase family protein [Actinomycetota bacterium]
VLHMGHVSLLAQARSKGDVLIVGLNSDESIRANKGPDRPVCTQAQRASVLASLESVDYVVIYDETEPIALLDKLRPDILVKGEDCIARGVVGRELVEGYGGKVELVPMVQGCSTTNIIQTILSKYAG